MQFDPALYYVLARQGGKKILVTPETRKKYSNSVEFIRLNELVPTGTPDVLEKAGKKAKKSLTTEQKAKKAAAAKQKRAEKKAADLEASEQKDDKDE